MIKYEKFILDNGLKVIVHQDKSTPMVAVNLLYNVGARDEDENRTGFAHLFEHLMFGGSANIPNFDEPLQRVGGENNAFTSNDLTNYYITLPKNNIETALWLESDRMKELAFTPKSLATQKNVVIEEFKQNYLNQPYGDVWMLLRELTYKKHPYKWATIGKSIEHIEQATMDEVKSFFYSHYLPNNAILSIAGDLTADEVNELVNKWFSDIPSKPLKKRQLPIEPKQIAPNRLEVERDVPVNVLYKAYKMCKRSDKEYYATDLLSDILSLGESSRLYKQLVKKEQIFSEISAYVLGSFDDGLFVITGKLQEGVSFEHAEEKVIEQISIIQNQDVEEQELNKVKNKVESTMVFSETNVLNKAMNLAIAELIDDANLVNLEKQYYQEVTAKEINNIANKILVENNCSTLIYKKKNDR